MFKLGDRVKVRGTRETYDAGIANKLGTIVAVKAGGDILHAQLDMGGRVVKLSLEEFLAATEKDEMRNRDKVDVFPPLK